MLSEHLAALDTLHDELAHWRAMYRACFHAACDELCAAQTTIKSQRRQLAELREERARFARTVFADALLREQA